MYGFIIYFALGFGLGESAGTVHKVLSDKQTKQATARQAQYNKQINDILKDK